MSPSRSGNASRMFGAKLFEREAFRYIFAYGETIAGLADSQRTPPFVEPVHTPAQSETVLIWLPFAFRLQAR